MMKWILKGLFVLIVNVSVAQAYKSVIVPFESNPFITSMDKLGNDFVISSRNFITNDTSGTTLVRIDSDLNLLYSRDYLGVDVTRHSVFVLENEERLIGIGDKSLGEGGHEFIAINKELNEISRNTYDSFSGDSGVASSVFIDDYLYGVIRDNYAPMENDITIIKIDTLGNRIWLKKIDFNTEFNGTYDVFYSQDGNILLATEYVESSEIKVHLSKISSLDASIIWQKTQTEPKQSGSGIWLTELSNENIVLAHKIDKSFDAPYLAQGYHPIPPQIVWNDKDGNFIKDYFFKSKPHYASLQITRLIKGNGDYFFGIGNRVQEDFENGKHGWIFKMDNEGNILWNRKYHHTDYIDVGISHTIDYILELDNGDIITAGTARDPGMEGEVWVMRLNSDGCLGDYCGDPIVSTGEINNTLPSVLLFPNPSSGVFHFKEYMSFDLITITDLSGKIVHQVNSFSGQSLDLSALINGKYLLHFYVDNKMEGVSEVVITK